MNKLYEIVEYEEVKIYKEQVYNTSNLQKCREVHKKLVSEGTIEGDFDSDKWIVTTVPNEILGASIN